MEVNVSIMDLKKGLLENQILGSCEEIESHVRLLASVTQANKDGKLKPIFKAPQVFKAPQGKKKAFRSMQNLTIMLFRNSNVLERKITGFSNFR